MSPFRDDDVKFRAPTHKHHCWNNVLWPPQKFSKILWILIRYYHSSHQFDTYKVNKIRIKADFLFTSRHVTSRHMPLTYIVTYVRQRPQKRPNNSCIDTVKLWRDWKKRQRHRIYRYSALTDTNHYSLTCELSSRLGYTVHPSDPARKLPIASIKPASLDRC